MNKIGKSGPVHFFVTSERDAHLADVVEYCVQVGERHHITRSQARGLVGDGKVLVDGALPKKCYTKLSSGPHALSIRGRTHHVIVHGCEKE